MTTFTITIGALEIGARIRYRAGNGIYRNAKIIDRDEYGMWIVDDEFADPVPTTDIRMVFHPGKNYDDAWTFEARYAPAVRDQFMDRAPFTYVNRALQAG